MIVSKKNICKKSKFTTRKQFWINKKTYSGTIQVSRNSLVALATRSFLDGLLWIVGCWVAKLSIEVFGDPGVLADKAAKADAESKGDEGALKPGLNNGREIGRNGDDEGDLDKLLFIVGEDSTLVMAEVSDDGVVMVDICNINWMLEMNMLSWRVRDVKV